MMSKEKTVLFIDRGNGYERLYTEQEVINNLQQRIDKAIEYIRRNKSVDDYGKFVIEDDKGILINILKGDSDERKI